MLLLENKLAEGKVRNKHHPVNERNRAMSFTNLQSLNPEGLINEKINAHNCQAYFILRVAHSVKKDVHVYSIQIFVCTKA